MKRILAKFEILWEYWKFRGTTDLDPSRVEDEPSWRLEGFKSPKWREYSAPPKENETLDTWNYGWNIELTSRNMFRHLFRGPYKLQWSTECSIVQATRVLESRWILVDRAPRSDEEVIEMILQVGRCGKMWEDQVVRCHVHSDLQKLPSGNQAWQQKIMDLFLQLNGRLIGNYL